MSRPPLVHRPTSITLPPGTPSEQRTEYTSGIPPEEKAENTSENLQEAKTENASVSPGMSSGQVAEITPEAHSHKTHRDDILVLVGIVVMLIWPWVFFGVIWGVNGVRMNNHVARVARDNPHGTTYFVTLIGTIISMIISSLFSLAIIRFAQEWVTENSPVEVFQVTVLSAIRHQNWPWGTNIESLRSLLDRKRWWPAAMLIFCIAIFTFVTSSITSLIGPIQFNQIALLTGTELDFSSSAADCLHWFDEHPRSNDCNWQNYKGLDYSSCLSENQMVDVLESGRGNILASLSNYSQSLTFSQLGNNDGLHFLGSIRGVLPIGPNGVPAFDTLKDSPFSNPELRAAMISYNYTLEHQGLGADISCVHKTSSPIVSGPVDPPTALALQYNSTCDGIAQVLTDVQTLEAVNSNHSLLFWACQAPPDPAQEPSYFIYLRGRSGYQDVVQNITCTASLSPRTLIPVTYESIPGIFSPKNPISTSASTRPFLIQQTLIGLASFMKEAQNWQSHQMAESVITIGVKAFDLPPDKPDDKYLELYAAMLQGILDYEATYVRLIYSTVADPPPSCLRDVSGQLSYEVLGWFVQAQNIGYLLPMTLVNLASLVILILALRMAKRSDIRFDPTDPREILYCANVHGDPVADEWKDKVEFKKAKVFRAHFEDTVSPKLEEGVENVITVP